MNNIPTNLSVAAQLPNDPKVWVLTKTTLASLGTSNNLAYTYYKGMRVYCAQEKEIYEWREVTAPGEPLGLVATNFIYPNGLIVNGVDYSLKEYNFFKVLTPEDVVATTQTYTAANTAGLGQGVYKDTTIPVPNTQQFNFKTVNAAPAELTGTSLIQDVTTTANEVSINVKTLDTSTLIFDLSTPGKLKVDLPNSASIPALIVNGGYIPTYNDWVKAGGHLITNPAFDYKGDGTLAKPITNTIRYTGVATFIITQDTAVENAIEMFIGSGTRLLPELSGRAIELYSWSSAYIYTGNIACNQLKLFLKPGSQLWSIPTDDWFCNLDDVAYFTNTTPLGVSIFLENDAAIILYKNGFKNSGTNIPTFTYAQSKILYIDGVGAVIQNNSIENGDTPGDYTMFSLNESSLVHHNDANALLDCRNINIRSVINPILKSGGNISDFRKVQFTYGQIGFDINSSVIPFNLFGGSYIRTEDCKIYYFGNSVTTTGINLAGQNTILTLYNTIFNGTLVNLVNIDCQSNANYLLDSSVSLINTLYIDGITATNLINATFPGGRTNKHIKSYINGCYFSKGRIDKNKIDLTGGNIQSCTYYVGRQADFGKQIVEWLIKYPSRAAAALDLDYGARFINTNGLPIEPSDPSFKLDIVI